MNLDDALRSKIERVLDAERVVLFMKGTRARPQ